MLESNISLIELVSTVWKYVSSHQMNGKSETYVHFMTEPSFVPWIRPSIIHLYILT